MDQVKQTPAKAISILRHAEKLFAHKGFEATSVREIAHAAKVNVAMISYYFGSKEKLLEKLFEKRMTSGLEFVQQIMESPELNEWQKMTVILRNYVNNIFHAQNFYLVMLSIQVTTKNKRILALLRRTRLNYIELFDLFALLGVEKRLFKYRPDPYLLQSTIIGSLYYALQMKPVFKDHSKNHQSLAEFDEEYFNKLFEYLKNILATLLGYEDN